MKQIPTLARKLYQGALASLPLSAAVRLEYYRRFRSMPDLSQPRTFNEKVNWRKLNDRNPLFSVYADKVSVKRLVSERVGSDWIIPTLYSGVELPPVQERDWTLPFVIKANHASGWNHFVRQPADLDWPEIERKVERWLSTPWYPGLGEWWYNSFDRQILVEPIVGDVERAPLDYKFFVFSGRAMYVQVITDRFTLPKCCFYDRNWRRQPFQVVYAYEPREIAEPKHFYEMLNAAEIIAGDLDFARVDLYDVGQHPLFGEVTLAPGAGVGRFRPSEFDLALGSLWTLPS